MGRSKAASLNKQIESKTRGIMQEGDERPWGKQLSPETFIDFFPHLLGPRDYQINSHREAEG